MQDGVQDAVGCVETALVLNGPAHQLGELVGKGASLQASERP